MSVPFSTVLASVERAGDSWTVSVPDDWKQGRSVFGGMQSALALHAMRRAMVADAHAAAALPLRVLQTTFVAPMSGAGTRIDVRVLRAGKSTRHVEARLSEGTELVAIVVGVFGAARSSEVQVAPRQRPLESDGQAEPRAFSGPPPASLPAFLQHFTMRWRRGGPPGTGTTANDAVVEVSLHDTSPTSPAPPTSEEHLVALADAVPPQALSMLKKQAFGSSLTWTLEILRAGALASLPLVGWRMDVELVAAGEGYTSQSVMVWGPGGEAVAASRQCMVVFG
jgi:acyl-coenzyme A thioesterase PaaI-like protein